MKKKIAVLLPCYNEEVTIEKVVNDFRFELPEAEIYVFDNNSADQTAAKALRAGALVIPSPMQGKGNVVQHMFNTVDADVYLMADGDDTYPAIHAKQMIYPILYQNFDMVVGTRLASFSDQSFRKFHFFGNTVISTLISKLFGLKVSDVLSGYRAFSRAYVKGIPLVSRGFEIETELTLQTVAKNFSLKEIPISYGHRPKGSHSKLNTFSDGLLIIKLIFLIFKDYRPLLFFGGLSLLFALCAGVAGFFPIRDFYLFHFVHHVPLAILASALGILSFFSFFVGAILDTQCKYHHEVMSVLKRGQEKNLAQATLSSATVNPLSTEKNSLTL